MVYIPGYGEIDAGGKMTKAAPVGEKTANASPQDLIVGVSPQTIEWGPRAGQTENVPYVIDPTTGQRIQIPNNVAQTDWSHVPSVVLKTPDGTAVRVPQFVVDDARRTFSGVDTRNLVPGSTAKPVTTTTPAAGPSPAAPKVDTGPTGPSGVKGMTNKEYDAFKAAAKTAIQQLGVLDYEPTDSEIASFFNSGFDAEAITNYYTSDPVFVARNPGAPFGLSRDEYGKRLGNYASAWSSTFGSGTTMPTAPAPTATKSERDSNLLGYALKQGIGDREFGATLESFRQARGRAPSTSEYQDFSSRMSSSAVNPPASGRVASLRVPQSQARPATGGGR